MSRFTTHRSVDVPKKEVEATGPSTQPTNIILNNLIGTRKDMQGTSECHMVTANISLSTAEVEFQQCRASPWRQTPRPC